MLRIKEQELKIAEITDPKSEPEAPSWFREYVEATRANPIVRPVPTEHDRGIIPDESSEDAGDADPSEVIDEDGKPIVEAPMPTEDDDEDPDAGDTDEDEEDELGNDDDYL